MLNVDTITAEELYRVFQDNEVSAEQRYKGRLIHVAGTVRSVTKEAIKLNERSDGYNHGFVVAYLEGKSREQMVHLNKGQAVLVKGICAGKHQYSEHQVDI